MDINKYKIVFSPTSKKQFKKIYNYISNNLFEKKESTHNTYILQQK